MPSDRTEVSLPLATTPAPPELSTVSLSVVVPVFNEEDTLAEAMRTFCDAAVSVPFEIICVDDGSTDSSLEILNSFADDRITVVASARNEGKGAALRKGFERATGDYILIQDADLEYSPDDWEALLRPVLRGDTEVVYGSRFLGNRTGMKVHSYLANRFLTLLTKILFGSSITDMETCFKLVRADILRDLPLNADRFDFEPQVTALLLKSGLRIVEVPIDYQGRDKDAGKKIGFRDGIEAIAMLFRCARTRSCS